MVILLVGLPMLGDVWTIKRTVAPVGIPGIPADESVEERVDTDIIGRINREWA